MLPKTVQSETLINYQQSAICSTVDICMPIYNPNLCWLSESLQSISAQDFIDWRLILILDCMASSTKHYIQKLLVRFNIKYKTLVLDNKEKGLVNCLNLGLSYVTAPYFARMDYDDRMLPQRLNMQIKLLEANTSLAGCGSQIAYLSHNYEPPLRSPSHHPISYLGFLVFGSFLNNPIPHPTLVIRSHIVKGVSGYKDIVSMEDYDLLSRCLDYGIFLNINEVLLEYRIHPFQQSKLFSPKRKNLFIVRFKFYKRLCRANIIWSVFLPLIFLWFFVGPRVEKNFRNFLLKFICNV